MAVSLAVPLLCDIATSGKLLEFGVDGSREVECASKGVQTELSKSDSLRGRKGKVQEKVVNEAEKSELFASAVVRLAIGLLGLEVHEKPNAWAEVWLSFQEAAARKLEVQQPSIQSICAADCGEKTSKVEWQQKVLLHLQQLFDPKMVAKTAAGPHGMAEQLDLAEFTLERITHAVNLLQDPKGNSKPMLLQGYTDAMTAEVCTDLRQWLQKLAELMSFYHIFILDGERENRFLREKLEAAEAKYQSNEESQKDALRRATAADERWNDFKMKRRAEAVLGVSLDSEDDKIYSQREVDELYKQWTDKYVTPLLEELEDLRNQLDNRRLGSKRRTVVAPEVISPSSQMSSAQQQLLSAALFAASERAPDPLGDLLWQLGDRVKAGDDYRDVALAIQALPPLDPLIKMGQDVAAVLSKNDVDLLQAVLKATSDHVQGELGEELLRFRSHFGTDSDELPEIARAIIGLASSSPRAAAKGSLKSVSVNTTATMVLPTAPSTPLPTDSKENDFRAELERLRAQLEAELRAAREEAELQRRKAEEAIKKMEEEAQRADGLLDEMRKRLKTMHSALQKAGVEKEAEEALEESGLVTFFKGRDVFERLYQDALRRMRIQAENQLLLLSRATASFVRTLQSLATHPMTAVNAALELHGAAVLLSSPVKVLGYSHEQNAKDPSETGGKGLQLFEANDGQAKRAQRIRTSSFGSLDQNSSKAGQSISKGRGINRAVSLGAVGQAWTSSQTLRQTVFPGPSRERPKPDPPELVEARDPRDIGAKHSGLLPKTRPGTGNMRSRPVVSSERPASGRAKTSPMLMVSRLSGNL